MAASFGAADVSTYQFLIDIEIIEALLRFAQSGRPVELPAFPRERAESASR